MKCVLFLSFVALIASSSSSPVRELKVVDPSTTIATTAKAIVAEVSSTQATPTTSKVTATTEDYPSTTIATTAKAIIAEVSSTQATPTTSKVTATTEDYEDEYADPEPDDGISNSAILSLVG